MLKMERPLKMIEHQDNGRPNCKDVRHDFAHDTDHDNGGTRTGYERRQDYSSDPKRDRRLGLDRRNGADRRIHLGRKREFERRDIFNGVDE